MVHPASLAAAPLAAALLAPLVSAAPAPLTQDATVIFGGRFAPAPPQLGLGSTLAASSGDVATVVMSNVSGSASANVPGLVGVTFEPGLDTDHFDRIYGHPGGHWIITALADLPTARNECLIVDGQLVMQEGSPAPWTAGAENCGTIDTRCAVNASGDIVFATNSSATSADDYMATRIGGVWGYAAREGDAVPGVAGGVLDDSIDTGVILDDGRVGFSADGIDGSVTADLDDDVLVLGGALLLRKGVSAPAGQSGGAAETLDNFDLNDYWASGDGVHWLVQGDLSGSTGSDDVVIVNGAVVVQEGAILPGSGFTDAVDQNGIFGVSMDAAGHWFVRGDNDGTNQDWVVRDGAVIALGMDPIVAGATERWDDARFSNGFFAHVGNGFGDYVVGGMTDAVDEGADAVLVVNGSRVVARESDPVDLDGNGLLDDGVFIDSFGDDDLYLSGDLELLVVATLKDATGERIGQALVSLDASPGIGTEYCDAELNSLGLAARITALGSESAAENRLRLVARDMPANSYRLFLVGDQRSAIPGLGQGMGVLCVGTPTGRFLGPGQVGRTDIEGMAELAVDFGSIPLGPGGTGSAVAGDTLTFQCWYRDVTATGMPTSNMTNGVEIVLQ